MPWDSGRVINPAIKEFARGAWNVVVGPSRHHDIPDMMDPAKAEGDDSECIPSSL